MMTNRLYLSAPFNHYLNKWHLVPDGDPIITNSSQLLPVIYKGSSAILKIAILMVWWNGEGAARVFKHEDDAILMERAIENRSLVSMTKTGQDDEASKIIYEVVTRLHAKRQKALPTTLVHTKNYADFLNK